MTENLVQFSLKVSYCRINYRPKTVGDDCFMIVRLPSDVIVPWDYRPNPNTNMYFNDDDDDYRDKYDYDDSMPTTFVLGMEL